MERLVGMGHGGFGNAAIHTGGDDGGKGAGDREGVFKMRGMGLDEFRSLRKGHADKIALAAELRQSTTMKMAWIAEQLNAGVAQTFWKALWKTGKKATIRGPLFFFPFSFTILLQKEFWCALLPVIFPREDE